MIKTILIISIVVATIFQSCGSKTCDFSSLDTGIDCACEIKAQKEELKHKPSELEALEKQVKLMDEAFDKAIEEGVFTEEEFVAKFEATCDAKDEK